MSDEFLIIDGRLVHNYRTIKPEIGNPDHIRAFQVHQIHSNLLSKSFKLTMETNQQNFKINYFAKCGVCKHYIETGLYDPSLKDDPRSLKCNYCLTNFVIINKASKTPDIFIIEKYAVDQDEYIKEKNKFNKSI